jgi:hypothetical protein
MESTALLMFRKAAHISQHSFAIPLYQVYLTERICVPEEDHLNVYTSTWTMHVHIMHGDPLNVFTQKRFAGCRTRFTARISHQQTSYSLVISSASSPDTTSLTGEA